MCTKGLRSTLLLQSVGGNPLSILAVQCGDRNHLSTTDASVRRREPFRIYTGGGAGPIQKCQRRGDGKNDSLYHWTELSTRANEKEKKNENISCDISIFVFYKTLYIFRQVKHYHKHFSLFLQLTLLPLS